MISFLLYSHIKKELKPIKSISVNEVSILCEEEWKINDFFDDNSFIDYLEQQPEVDISCIDITGKMGVTSAEKARNNSNNMYIILIADTNISPAKYIKPSIMAGSLLLRPLTKAMCQSVLKEAFLYYINKYKAEDGNKSFVVNTRDGKQLVQYNNIMFFESREKKIFLNTKCFEYSFYDTLDNLELKLDDSFLRCHRSFIVSKEHIKKIKLSQNIIILDNDCQIPLSRSYKSVFKELKC